MGYKKDEYDYTKGGNRSIDKERVREELISNLKDRFGLEDEHLQNEEVQTHINDVVNQIMFSFNEQLSYFVENFEGKLDEIMDTITDNVPSPED